MKSATMIAALTAATIGATTFVALAQPAGGPPTPKPAAGALPQPPSTAVAKTFRAQTPEEQKASAAAATQVPLNSSRMPTPK
jgi:hypothetical protein